MQYSGALTREQFMFQEMRITARLKLEGLTDQDIIATGAILALFIFAQGESQKKWLYLP